MKKSVFFVAVAVAAASNQVIAGGGWTGGSTEFTQIANQVQLGLSYAKQVAEYIRQGEQLQIELTNMTRNPASLLGPEIGNLINDVGRLMSAGNSIGSNLAQIDKNFSTNFKSSEAKTLAANFTQWHHTSTDTLEGALKAAGLHRENYVSESSAVQALYNQSQGTVGNLDALQTLSKINIEQVQQMRKLGDLISTQNLATSTYMASEEAKSQARIDKSQTIMGDGKLKNLPPGKHLGGI